MSFGEEGRAAARALAEGLLHPGLPDAGLPAGDHSRQAAALARLLDSLPQEALRRGVLEALGAVQDPAARDAIWAVWAERRRADLGQLLRAQNWPAIAPPSLSVLANLWTGRTQALADAPPAWVEPLLAAVQDADPFIAQAAQKALRSLHNSAAQEELCRWVIEFDSPAARAAALEAGFAPSDPHRRALFFLLTEQWERYEQLDFDAALLRAVYETGSPELRARIAALARRAGWSGYVEAVAGQRQARRLGELSPVEWEVVLTLLSRQRRWEEVYRLAQHAPALWSAHSLQRLQEAGWHPPQADEIAGFQALLERAAAALPSGPPALTLARFQAALFGHQRQVSALAGTPDGRLLLSASLDRSVRLWRLPEAELERVLDEHRHYVLSLAVSPDGAAFASGSADKTVRLWALPSGQLLHTLGSHAGQVRALGFSPSGHLLATGDDVTARLWQLPAARLTALLPEHSDSVRSLAFSPDGRLLVTLAEDHSLRLWRLPGGELERSLLEKVSAWSLNEKGELLTASPYGRVRRWGLPEAHLIESLEGRCDGLALVLGADWTAASDRQEVRLWQSGETGREGQALTGHERPVVSLAASPDGRLLASGSEDRTVALWSLPEGRLLRRLEGFSGPVRQLHFLPGGAFLAASSDETIRLFALEDLRPVFQTPLSHLRPEKLDWAAQVLPPDSPEAVWLAYVQALFQWRRRFDISLEEGPRPIQLGEFDIEIAG